MTTDAEEIIHFSLRFRRARFEVDAPAHATVRDLQSVLAAPAVSTEIDSSAVVNVPLAELSGLIGVPEEQQVLAARGQLLRPEDALQDVLPKTGDTAAFYAMREVLLGVRPLVAARRKEASKSTRPWYGRPEFHLQCGPLDLRIRQTALTPSTGGSVWGAGASFAKLVQTNFFADTFWHKRRVLELGSGTGVLGLSVALTAQTKSHGPLEVMLTDIPDGLSLLKENMEANSVADTCSVKALDWDDFVQALELEDEQSSSSESNGHSEDDLSWNPLTLRNRVDIVVGADLVYWQEPGSSFEKLVRWLLAPTGGGASEFWYMHEWRSTQRELAVIDSMASAGVKVVHVPMSKYAALLTNNNSEQGSEPLENFAKPMSDVNEQVNDEEIYLSASVRAEEQHRAFFVFR